MVTLLIISMFAALASGILRKIFTNQFENNPFANQVFNFITSITAALVLIVWGGFSGFSWFTIFLAVAFGVITAIQQISNLKAMNCGPWSYTSVIASLSTLIPALSGFLIWRESLHWAQIVGIVLMVVCFIFSIDSKEEEKAASVKWLIWCLITFFCTGFIGVMQKWHQSSDFKGQLNTFLIFAFIISSVYSLVCCITIKLKENKMSSISDMLFGVQTTKHNKQTMTKKILLTTGLMVLVGVGCAVNNKLNLYLSGVMDSAVFFPIVNGGGLVLTTLAAAIVFKEKLSRKQWLGLIVGIISVLFLANPFA